MPIGIKIETFNPFVAMPLIASKKLVKKAEGGKDRVESFGRSY